MFAPFGAAAIDPRKPAKSAEDPLSEPLSKDQKLHAWSSMALSAAASPALSPIPTPHRVSGGAGKEMVVNEKG